MPTEQQTETRQGIAREIAKRYTREGTGYADRLYQLAYAIEAALKDRDESTARIADAKAIEWGELADRYWNDGDCSNARIRQGWAAGARTIATIIRSEGNK